MKQQFGSVVVGGILLIIGCLFVWEGVPHTYSVICDRTAEERIDCQKQEKVLWWIPIKNTSLKHLQAVYMGKGDNAYDSIVYFIHLRGESSNLMFGNTLDLEEIQGDLVKAQQFLKDKKTPSLILMRYEVDWISVIVGFPIVVLGFWIVFFSIVNRKIKG